MLEDLAAEKDAGEDGRDKNEIDGERAGRDDAELPAKGEFEQIEKKEKSSSEAKKMFFFKVPNKSVDRINGSSGVGHHSGDANGQ